MGHLSPLPAISQLPLYYRQYPVFSFPYRCDENSVVQGCNTAQLKIECYRPGLDRLTTRVELSLVCPATLLFSFRPRSMTGFSCLLALLNFRIWLS